MAHQVTSGGFLVTADWHAHTWRDGAQLRNGVNDRLLDLIHVLREMVTYALGHGVSHIFVLGDIFHLKKNVPVQAMDVLWECLTRATQDGIEWIFLVGNHDREIDREDAVTILPFRSFATVITDIEINRRDHIVYVPWLYDQSKVTKTLATLKGDWDLLFYHGELDGAFVGPTDYQLKSKVTAKMLRVRAFRNVFAGHLHRRQHVEGVWYPGNPLPKDFGELEWDKGFLHVLPDRQVEIRTIKSPRFIVNTYEQPLNYDHVKVLLPMLAGNFVRLIVPDAPQDELILKLRTEGHPRLLDIRLQRAVSPMVERQSQSRSLETLVTSYVDEKGVVADQRPRYVDYGLHVLKKAET